MRRGGGSQRQMQLCSVFSLAASLAADFAVDLFVDGGYVTEQELFKATYLLFCVMDVLSIGRVMLSVSNTFVQGVKQKENSRAVIFPHTANNVLVLVKLLIFFYIPEMLLQCHLVKLFGFRGGQLQFYTFSFINKYILELRSFMECFESPRCSNSRNFPVKLQIPRK